MKNSSKQSGSICRTFYTEYYSDKISHKNENSWGKVKKIKEIVKVKKIVKPNSNITLNL